ncbi:E3 ubiquitin-protein ligase CCNB1IP1 [Paramormyrops kingsleyae]|uniref:Cyclin B1 interacting protein 1 n=1 Tax=Paramormyrops kingsleyae TaxID=1676925 RepID=A0A3B3SSJ3_9TELE|nr:E3 ubiquitin-protein ligase CCNB1IP1 [Paramormyrops kingsleyae]XP_023692171.1 E3 ubiquitin-protein ligase CCNB1IP1 [Paramormyrops kingsleyae]XP_023692172.1 E3 ubiquitin-protein ligase CCNB1IP1 [Paramormyrops kingsleyae]
MSLCEDFLLCNFPKCRAKLSGFAWVTACSHAFCDQHGSGEFSHSPAICPACSSALSGKLDIVRTELAPSEEYKAMVLAGLRPEIVLDISARALAFWTYQVHQERLFQEYSLSRAETQVKQAEKLLAQQSQSRELELSAMRGEISSLKKVMEEYKRKYSEVSERLMERNRQYQKLQGLYDSLRLRNMVVGEREGIRFAPPEFAPARRQDNTGMEGHHSTYNSPSFLGTGSEGNKIFSTLEPDHTRSFFRFNSPANSQSHAFVRKQ